MALLNRLESTAKLNKNYKHKLQSLKKSVKLFREDRKNANCLLEITALLNSDDDEMILACIQSLHKLFVGLLNEDEMFMKSSIKESSDKGSKQQYVEWLQARYVDVQEKFCSFLTHPNKNIRDLSLRSLMAFIANEGKHPLHPVNDKCFPSSMFNKVVAGIVSSESDNKKLIERFHEFSDYDDVNFNLIKSLCIIVKTKRKDRTEISENELNNIFGLIEQIKLENQIDGADSIERNNLCVNQNEELNYKFNYAYSRKIFSVLWLDFLNLKLTSSLYKKILIILHSKVLPHLEKPLHLTDFLIDSYNIGGAVSLLALNGLFFLIQKFNLEYPDFYKKLYSLFEPSVFHAKYSARFFHLADIFLSSTHLPSYLVAAFVKRLSRLSLTSPVKGLFVILPFVGNLLIRHPNLISMINRTGEIEAVESDPYLMDEQSPIDCKAMDSSLWEIKTLQSHWHPDIASKAHFIDKPLPKIEWDLSEYLEITYEELIDQQTNKKLKTCPINYSRPSHLFDADIMMFLK